jgi:hypothetical protein
MTDQGKGIIYWFVENHSASFSWEASSKEETQLFDFWTSNYTISWADRLISYIVKFIIVFLEHIFTRSIDIVSLTLYCCLEEESKIPSAKWVLKFGLILTINDTDSFSLFRSLDSNDTLLDSCLQINGFARRFPGLMSLRSVDLSPASWMAVAWLVSQSLSYMNSHHK